MAEKDTNGDARKRFDAGGLSELPFAQADIPPEHLDFLKGLVDTFNASTTRLKEAYAGLQEKVTRLNLKLEETNRELSESLAEQERLSNYLTNILESLSSGVLVIGTDGRITLFNRGAAEITGIAESDALGASYRDIMGEDVPDELTPLWILSNEGVHTLFEKTVVSANGDRVPLGCSISPLRNSSGEMIGAVEIFMDMSRIKSLEDELARKEKLAALGQMAATMAHKIRNPLGGIAGFAGLLRLELTDCENGKRLVGKITEGVDKLERIVNSLLAYTSRLRLEPRMVDVGAFVEESVASFMVDYPETKWTVGQPDGSVMAEIDTEHVGRALKSVLRNAVDAVAAAGGDGAVGVTVVAGDWDYTPGHPRENEVLARIRSESDLLESHISGCIVLVADDGGGMDARSREQLFVPFYTTKEEGIGLGLASVLKIVEAHRGEIWIETKEREGTAVGLVFPRLQGA